MIINKRICFQFSIFIFLFLSCQNNVKTATDIITINAWPESAENKKMSELFNKPEFIFLETNPNTLVGRIRKIEITKKFIVILNDAPDYSINVFSRDGNHISTFNRYGNGPCEYNSPQFIIVNDPDSTIELISPVTNELITYSLSGDCLENIVFPVFGMDGIKISESEYLIYLSGIVSLEKNKLLKENIQLVDKKEGILDSYLPFETESGPAFLTISRDNFSRIFNKIYISLSCYDTIYIFNPEDKVLIPKFYLDFNGHNIPSQLIREPYRTIGHFNKMAIDGNYVYGINSARWGSNSLFFTFQFGEKAEKYYCLHSFSDGKSTVANHICNDFIGEFFYHPIRTEDIPWASFNDELFFCYDPGTLKNINKIAEENMSSAQYLTWSNKYDSLLSIYSNLERESNPILLKVEL